MSPDELQRHYDSLGKSSRRGFLKGVAAALVVTRPAVARARQNQANLAKRSILAYVGAYSSPQGPEGSKGNGQGIYLFQMNPSTGALSQRELFSNDSNPSWLAFDPSRSHLYAANETPTFQDSSSGSASAFSIDRSNGHLTLLNTVSSEGAGPAHLSVHPSGKYALVANYAMHGTVLGGKYLEISGDGPGVVAAYVSEKIGAPMLYVNGAAGNIAPIYTVTDNPRSGHLSEFNVLLGDRILEANRAMGAATAEVKLWAAEHVIETPRKNGMGWPEELGAYSRVPSAGAPLVRLPVRFLRLNDTLVWAAPVELFCEIALRVRAESPFSHTFYFGYANGWLGYRKRKPTPRSRRQCRRRRRSK